MDFLPIFLNIRDRDCLVVGGGDIAARKTALLLKAGARVRIVSPTLSDGLNTHLQQGRITYAAEPLILPGI